MHLVKLAVLGAAGCGKTSLIRQFVRHEFSDSDEPTKQKRLYYPTVVVEDRLYEVQIVDLPPIIGFPEDTYEEWAFYKGYGLRSANAYVLIFDIDRPDTFQLVKRLRDQIVASRPDPLIVVAGNKQDLLLTEQSQSSSPVGAGLGLENATEGTGGRNRGIGASHRQQQQQQQQGISNKHQQHSHSHSHSHHHHHHHHKPKSRQSSNDRILSNGSGDQQQITRSALDVNKEYSNLVKKQWKCPYVECSAKYNWHVTTVFLELMKLIERQMDTNQQKSVSHSMGGRRRCKIQ